jgi:hypothetical protein
MAAVMVLLGLALCLHVARVFDFPGLDGQQSRAKESVAVLGAAAACFMMGYWSFMRAFDPDRADGWS